MLLVVGACGDDTSAVSVDTDATGTGTGTGGDDGGPSSNTNATMTTAVSDSLDGTSSDGGMESESGPSTLDDTSEGGESSSEGGESSSEGGESSSSDGGGPACGDDNVDAGEQCDGQNLDGEDCGSQGFDRGVLACAADCTFDTSGCINTPTCGDGDVGVGEDCDGANLDGQTCVTQGFPAGGTLACAGDCTFDTSGCNAQPTCGNGGIDAGEDCDGANLDGETCATQGFAGGTLACAGNCTFDTSACTNPPPCGNGALDAGETCDGANLDGETCATQGFDGGTLTCAADCGSFDTSGCTNLPSCGDGTCDAGEDSCSCVADCPDNADSCSACECGGDGGNCFCDAACVGFGDCCADACANCGACDACGDNTASGTEVCDGTDLGGQTCVTQGFPGGGTLSCLGDCSGFDTSGCGAGGCAHPLCETGVALTSGCDPCVTQVCAADPFCCSNSWDGICVGEVTSICGIPCGGGAVCGDAVCDPGEDSCNCASDCADDPNSCSACECGGSGGSCFCDDQCVSFGDCCADACANCGQCGGGSCAHPICETGAALTSGCDPCVTQVCAADPFCCSNSWDGICVGEVTSICGIPCGGATCGNGGIDAGEACDGANLNGQTCVSQGFPGGGTLACAGDCATFDTSGCSAGGCAHPICDTGVALTSGCDPCVTQVCAADPFCCSNSWDGICVGEVTSICGIPCGGGGPVCGDGVCDAGEDSCNCAGDCADDPNSCSACECGGSGGSCFCDDQCVSFGDCCADACANCGQCGGGGSCAHPICETGAALTSGCDPCVTQVCAADPFCCSNSWDGICVGEVGSICGIACP